MAAQQSSTKLFAFIIYQRIGMDKPSVDNAEPINHTKEAGYWKFMVLYPIKMIRTWC